MGLELAWGTGNEKLSRIIEASVYEAIGSCHSFLGRHTSPPFLSPESHGYVLSCRHTEKLTGHHLSKPYLVTAGRWPPWSQSAEVEGCCWVGLGPTKQNGLV